MYINKTLRKRTQSENKGNGAPLHWNDTETMSYCLSPIDLAKITLVMKGIN